MAAHARAVDLRNNFDLLRLLAAGQVLFFHFAAHLQLSMSGAAKAASSVVYFFPGVPIFFVISGFLISMSFERSHDVRSYARNRFLRIYPALWVNFIVSLVLVVALGALSFRALFTPRVLTWMAAQLSMAQFYNPDFLRHFGIGVLNGSLWTIPVELTFYLLLPVFYRLIFERVSHEQGNLLVGAIALASFAAWYFAGQGEMTHLPLAAKLFRVSIVPHLHLFLWGTLLQRNFKRLAAAVEGKVLVWTAIYITLMLIHEHLLAGQGAWIDLPLTLVGRMILGLWAISFAFSYRNVSGWLLRGNDLSYGVYIYHCLVLNTFVHLGWTGHARYLVAATAIVLLLAFASWRLIEAPALELKKRSLRPVRAA